jgi:hypothetical protein
MLVTGRVYEEERDYLDCSPLQTHHEASDASSAEETSNPINLSHYMPSCIILGKARGILVAKNAEQQTDEVPHSDQDSVVSPIAGLGDQLSV